MARAIQCPSCGKAIPGDAVMCPYCRRPLRKIALKSTSTSSKEQAVNNDTPRRSPPHFQATRRDCFPSYPCVLPLLTGTGD